VLADAGEDFLVDPVDDAAAVQFLALDGELLACLENRDPAGIPQD
jgi:hypothetical protein